MINKYIPIFIIQITIIFCSSQKIQEINNICHKIDNKHSSNEISVKDFLKNNNYDFEKEKDYPKKNKLYDFLIGKKLEEEYEIVYFQVIKKYLLNGYIIPIIILWIIFGICFVLKKCLFKPNIKFNFILKISTIIIIIIFISIFILSIMIILKSKKLESSINDASCNLLKFFYELNHGKIKETNINLNILNNKKETDRWLGLYTLNSILLDTSEQVIKISNKKNETFSFYKEIKNDIEEYQNLISSLNQITSKRLPNPNINLDNEIFPLYLYEFNDISKKNSLINDIYNEYISLFINPFNHINLIYNYTDFLTQKTEKYDSQINDIFDDMSDYCYFIKDKSSNITNNIIIFQNHIEFIISFIKIVNILCILSSVIIIILVVLYFFKNLLWVKITLHISWNFIFLFIILYACIWYFIFNLSDGVENSIYLIEKEVLKTNTNLFFDTCLNTGESDLSYLFNIYKEDSALIEIEKYYKKIDLHLDSLSSVKSNSPNLKNTKKASYEISKYLTNYELSTNNTYESSDITFILNELSKLTNNYKEGKKNGYCDTNDIWVASKYKCKDHIYINRYDIKIKFERKNDEKYCFIIQDDYKELDLKNIYGDLCSEETYEQIVKYVSGLTAYYNNNENLIESIDKILTEMERYNKKLIDMIISQITKCENDLGDLIDVYQPVLGDRNITNLFKCGRLKKKLINFYDISYNQITYNCKLIKIYLVIIIILGLLGIIFIIINNYRNNKEVKRRYMKLQNKDLNNDGVELIEEVPGEDEDN